MIDSDISVPALLSHLPGGSGVVMKGLISVVTMILITVGTLVSLLKTALDLQVVGRCPFCRLVSAFRTCLWARELSGVECKPPRFQLYERCIASCFEILLLLGRSQDSQIMLDLHSSFVFLSRTYPRSSCASSTLQVAVALSCQGLRKTLGSSPSHCAAEGGS